MSNAVQICNLALSHLGIYPIAALSESTKTARECNAFYDVNRKAVLRDHDWGFARKRLTLALDTVTYSGWTYAYQYPSDCLAIRKITDLTGTYTGTTYDSDTDSYQQTGKVEYEVITNSALNSRLILSDVTSAELVYTANITDANMFDSLFVEGMGYRLGASLSTPLRGVGQLKKELLAQYYSVINTAKAVDSNESYKKPDHSSDFVRSRA